MLIYKLTKLTILLQVILAAPNHAKTAVCVQLWELMTTSATVRAQDITARTAPHVSNRLNIKKEKKQNNELEQCVISEKYFNN